MTIVDDYLENISAPQRNHLERVRNIVKEVVPDAEEVMSYGMPVFKYKKKYLIGFAAYKNHMSLFPTPEPIAALKNELSGFTLSKGTIQFTENNPVPKDIIIKLVAIRRKEINGE